MVHRGVIQMVEALVVHHRNQDGSAHHMLPQFIPSVLSALAMAIDFQKLERHERFPYLSLDLSSHCSILS